MSTHALSPDLFHGTTADLHAGDVVRPSSATGAPSIHGSQGYRSKQRSDQHAFATTSEKEAWQYADMATSGPRAPGSLGSNEPPKGRASVVTVRPAADQQLGAYHPDHPSRANNPHREVWHEHVSKTGFPVTGRIDIKPGHQGTFPIDWTPQRRARSHADVNHPLPEEVRSGHSGGSMYLDAIHNNFTAGDGPAPHHREMAKQYETPDHPRLPLGPQWT